MRVSKNLKKAALKAKEEGFEYVASVCSNHYHTTYYHAVALDTILESEEGIEISFGRYHGKTEKSLPSGTFKGYQEFMKRYA